MRMYRSVNLGRAPQIICCWILLFMALFVARETFAAGDLSLFGPKRYERAQGKPWAFTDNFNGCSSSANQALIRVQNGSGKESSLSSALINLNGANVFVEAEFKNQTTLLERTVTIHPGSNTIATQLKSGGQKETPFLVVTVIGLGCDSTPPAISAPQPIDGSLLNILRPAISASYGDNSSGAGIDTVSVRVTLDGNDITPACTTGGTSVSCTPTADLTEGGHNVTLLVSDLLQNFASLNWRFTTDTIAPRAAITAPANGQYLANRTVTVSGSSDDSTATITINGKAATVSGALFSVADVPLAEGSNTLALIAVDPAGNRTESGITVTADTSLPQIVITSPINGSFTGSSPINVSGTVSELPASLTINGAAVEVSSALTFTSTLSLAEGLNTLIVTAADWAGNKGSAIVTVNLDTVKPQILITTPVSGSLTKNPSLTVRGTVREPVTSLKINETPVAVTDSAFSSDLTLTEGQNSIAILAIDRAGNNGESTLQVTLDSTPPTTPTIDGLTTPTNRSPITVAGAAEPLSSLSLYNGAERVATIVTPQDGRFSFPEIILHEGENSFTVTALDLAGNESAPSTPITVVLDTVKPLVAIGAPQDKAILNTPAITVSGDIDDPTAAVTINGLAVLNSGGIWTLENFTLQEGNNSLLVEARDPAGNLGNSVVAVTLDTVNPTVTITAPPTDLYTNIRALTVSGMVSEPLASLTVNGSSTPLTGLTFTHTLTLLEGPNIITVEATDLAGNRGKSSVSVTLDTLAPQLSVIGPADGALLNSGQITFGAGTAEPVVSVTVNGVTAPVGTNGYTLPVTLTEGTNTLTVTAVDRAGNQTTSAITVTLDTTPPAITVTSPQADAFLKTPQITVTGTVSEPVNSLTINGVAASVSGLNFTLPITLDEGLNSLTIRALDRAGNEGIATLPVNLDTVSPVVTIVTPSSGLLTKTSQVTVSGTVSEENTAVTVNGSPAIVTGKSWSANYTLSESDNSLNVRVVDRAGNAGVAVVTVNLDTTPPAIPVLIQQKSPTNTAGVTVSGTAEANSTVKIAAAGAVIGTVIADAQGNFTLPNVTLAEGANSYTATASDAAGNESPAPVPLDIVLDTVKPVITVTAPQAGVVVNSADVLITGTVDEPLTSLTVNGSSTPLTDLAFTTVLALAAGDNSAIITATDLAGNVATTTLIIKRDSTPPVVIIATPLSGLLTKSGTVQVSGTVDDAEATLTANGAAVTNSNKSFSLTYTLRGGDNAITVEATDKAGNKGSATTTVTFDAIPPTLTITAPPEAVAGANVAINLTADDNRGLALVELKADGVPIWSGGNVPSVSEAVSYRLSPALNAGAVVALQARGTDAAGNEGTATATIRITQAAMGPGYLQGKVLEDNRGLKLEGATVVITDAKGVTRELTTAADGGYFLETTAGSALVKVAKPGFTTVERTVPVITEKNITVQDARVTKISDTRNLIDATGGVVRVDVGAGSKPARMAELNVPSGALAAPADLRLTPVSNQGLAGLLPLGWSPLAVVDVRALDPTAGTALETTLSIAATVKLPLPSSVTIDPAAPPLLALYDPASHGWKAKGSATVAADGLSATAEITTTGQYALVLPDPAPNAPAAPVIGQTLQPSALNPQPDFNLINATGRVVPQASPPSTGLKAAGEVVLTAKEGTTPTFTSGLILGSRITEKFDLKSGDKVESPIYSQDIVLYRYPCITSIGGGAVSELPFDSAQGQVLRTTFPVSPSKDYTIVDLLLGKVGIEIVKPDTSETGVMVGPDGGRLVDADGNILNIPPGALAQTTPVSTKTVSAATGAVGSDFTLIRAVEVNLTRQTLATSVTFSIPAPDGFNPSLPLIVAKQIDVKGVAKLKLVALARQSGTLISSELLTQPLNNSTTQLNSSGIYYFLQAKAPLGFVTGTVSDSGSTPFTGALVKSDSGSLVDLSASTGKYLLAAPVASFTATAIDLYKGDEITASGALTAASQVVIVDLKILMIPPTIAAITPVNGAINVQPDVPVVVTFSKPMDKSSINSQTLKLTNSTNSESIPGVITWNIDSKTVTFYPAEAFKQETGYTVTIAATVKDLQGYPLGSGTTSTFTVRKTTPPAMPPAGSIIGTFPDADGFITVTATQGSAETGNTVLLINDTSGEITSVTPATNGSFTGKVRGQLGDEIKVVLMDYSGNQTLVSYIIFKSDDGKYLVTAKGGKVEGEGGSILDIPEGALAGPTVIKVTVMQQANLPSPLQAPGAFLGAVNIDTGGIPFKSEVHLSIPLPAGFDPATPVFVTRPAEVMNDDGSVEKVYEIIDSTKVVNGRITTASPPFDGVMAFGSFAFIAFPTVGVGIVSGYTYQEMNGQPGYLEPPNRDAWELLQPGSNPVDRLYVYDRPVQRAVIRTPVAWNYVSYANNKGFYAGMTTLSGNVGATDLEYKVTAIHPLTMQRETKTGYLSADGSQNRNLAKLNFKLADKGTIPPDSAAPIIDISLAVAPSQAAPSRIIAGTVKTGTPLSLSITVTDQQLEWATINATFTAPGAAPIAIPSNLTQSGSGQVAVPDGKILMRYLYLSSFTSSQGGSSTYITPAQEGSYNFTITAKDATGNQSSRTIGIRAVPDGTSLGSGLEGAPTIDSVIPAADSKEIMVTAPIMVWFSEPVDNVNDSTFVLIDSLTGIKVPATVTSGLEVGRMQATLTPKGNLYYARKYEIRLTSAITDSYDNANGSRMNLASYSSFFTTKVPKGYDLATDQQFTGGRDIALYTFDAEDGESTTYAYVLAGDNGWRIVDVTDPTAPEVIHYATSSCSAYTQSNCRITSSQFDMRSVAINPDTKIMAITENIAFADGNQYGYVRFYDLSELPGFPPIVGRERLAEAYSGIPGRVAMYGNNAYVATTNVGVQVVGVEEAKSANGGSSDGSSIVGVYDSIGEGYGQPSDIITYGAAKALLTTTSGNLLMLDINYPLPQFMSKYQSTPHRISRAGIAADYPYLDQFGNQQMDDVAVVGTMDGKVLTLNLTDPYDQKYIATAKDKDGQELKTNIREISVSKESGLAFVTTVNSVQVIDFKDPGNPRLLIEIASLPDPTGVMDQFGNPIMLPIGATPAIVEKGGWVFLASQSQGMKVVDLDPFEIIVWDENGARMINDLAYGDGLDQYKKYHLELKFDDPTVQCNDEYLAGTISVRKGPTLTQLVQDPKVNPLPTKYDLTFDLSDDGKQCLVLLVEPATSIIKNDFIISNLPESDILADGADLTYTAVLFGGFGNKVVVDVRESGKRTLTHKGFDIEKPIFMAMDGNRDGKIDFDNPEDAEYLFWVNDDHDVTSSNGKEEDDDSDITKKDCDDDVISNMRDLEDFARLHIKVNKHIAILPNVAYYLKFKNAENSPAINIFEGVDNSINYLTKKLSSEKQLAKTRQATVNSLTEVELLKNLIKDKDKVSPFSFEGKRAGKGALTLIVKADGVTVFEKPVKLQIEPIPYFYDMYTVAATGSSVASTATAVKGEYEPKDDKAYVLYVHGWNMQDYEKTRWTETIFKRLWWQGYIGRVGSFSWPTLTEAQTSVLGYNFMWTTNYPRSENIAWNSAEALKNVLENGLSSHKGNIRLLGHSMGTVVAGEATNKLSGSGIVYRYIATQGAVPITFYDNTKSLNDRTFATPNISGYYYSGDSSSGDKAYLADSLSKTSFINYFNKVDFALDYWGWANTFKPDMPYSYSGNVDKYTQDEDQFFDLYSGIKRFPDDRYEIFSRILQSRYYPLGKVVDANGFIPFILNPTCDFDDKRYSHSKQFRSNIVAEKCYWDKLTSDFELPKSTK